MTAPLPTLRAKPRREPTVDRWLLEQLGRALAKAWRRVWGIE